MVIVLNIRYLDISIVTVFCLRSEVIFKALTTVNLFSAFISHNHGWSTACPHPLTHTCVDVIQTTVLFTDWPYPDRGGNPVH